MATVLINHLSLLLTEQAFNEGPFHSQILCERREVFPERPEVGSEACFLLAIDRPVQHQEDFLSEEEIHKSCYKIPKAENTHQHNK